jgi:hypothetical protein
MMSTTNQRVSDRLRNIRCFAAVIRSPVGVRNAFEGHRMFAWWWNRVLALHGKPIPSYFSVQNRCACVADGFRFYGWLYCGLAAVIGAAAFSCWAAMRSPGYHGVFASRLNPRLNDNLEGRFP